MKQLVKRADTRTTVTPNATMTTLASPTLGATSGRSLWQVDMAAGASGPVSLPFPAHAAINPRETRPPAPLEACRVRRRRKSRLFH